MVVLTKSAAVNCLLKQLRWEVCLIAHTVFQNSEKWTFPVTLKYFRCLVKLHSLVSLLVSVQLSSCLILANCFAVPTPPASIPVIHRTVSSHFCPRGRLKRQMNGRASELFGMVKGWNALLAYAQAVPNGLEMISPQARQKLTIR